MKQEKQVKMRDLRFEEINPTSMKMRVLPLQSQNLQHMYPSISIPTQWDSKESPNTTITQIYKIYTYIYIQIELLYFLFYNHLIYLRMFYHYMIYIQMKLIFSLLSCLELNEIWCKNFFLIPN